MIRCVPEGPGGRACRRLAPLLLAVALAACAGTSGERFYHLDAGPIDSSLSDYDGDVRVVLQGVPEVVDRPQIVLQGRPNEIEVLENDRWAESVRSGVTRALVQDLGHALPRAWVTAEGPGRGGRAVTVFVQIDLMSGTRAGEVLLAARWLVRSGEGGAGVADRLELRRTAPGTPAGIVAAWSAQIAMLAQAIAHSLPPAAP